MIPFPIPWRLVGAGAAVLAVIGTLWWIRHTAYDAGFADGKADSQAFYRPVIDQVTAASNAAKGRIEALEKASKAINSELERTHAEQTAALSDRARRAERRLAVLLRNAPRCDRDRVPEAAGSPDTPDGAPKEPARNGDAIDRAGRDLVTIAAGCEDDASRLADFQQWYRQHAALTE